MFRILMIGLSPHTGGIETFILNYYQNMDKTKFIIDFVKRKEEKLLLEDELIANGSKVIYIPRKYKNLKKYKEKINTLFKENKYDAVWSNSAEIPNIDFLLYAKKYGVKKIIVHGHTSNWSVDYIRRVFHIINRRRINRVATDFFACSKSAIDFMFVGNGRKKVKIIHNAIDLEKYKFSKIKRSELKNEYNLDGKKVIGTIGRIDPVKNQIFLIDLLYHIKKIDENIKLVIIGGSSSENEELAKLQAKIAEYELQDSVILAGEQKNIGDWLSLFDVFILPSLFEGLPFVSLEAQANGLPCILSTGISREANITGTINYLDLQSDISIWVDTALKCCKKERMSEELIYSKFEEYGYIIEKNVKEIEKILLTRNVEI